MLMNSACLSTKIIVAKLAQMGNFCLAKFDAMWPMVQMATSSASLVKGNHIFSGADITTKSPEITALALILT